MLLRVQRPALWLFDALGILVGANPSNLSSDLVPTMDVAQGGHAFAKYLDLEFVGAVGATVGPASIFVPQTFPKSPKYSYLMRMEAANPGTAAASFFVRSYQNPSFPMRLWAIAIGAGNYQSWSDIGKGAQWWYIPPDYEVTLETSAFTTTAGRALITLVQLPAGTKGW